MTLTRTMTTVLTADVQGTSAFYRSLLGLKEHFSSDWFVVLTHDAVPGLEFGILAADSDVAPNKLARAPGGLMMTFVVADVDATHETAEGMGADIVEPPRDLFYGQRRMLVRDPNGVLIDLSSPTAPAPS
ncbi:MAG: VOC family protein [Pseudomonadota bacterium]